jgi:hypothetical protein
MARASRYGVLLGLMLLILLILWPTGNLRTGWSVAISR